MAANDAILLFPSITCATLFFSLLLIFHSTSMAITVKQLHSFSNIDYDAKKRNSMETTSSTRDETNDSKTTYHSSTRDQSHTNSIHVPDHDQVHLQVRGMRSGRSRSAHHGSRLPWQQKRIFNASAHEVPSGPNPISNK
ncbi:CLAVATA3/ESR (CLE)-related protein TDIF-like [Quillaja saponaria]|uniref:CLAVATA3/ESR (CLE)-related protein TDIF-like n=1 Tax=Quillaja saponaria TaxID=32244 RepID=A0AAD7PVX8_QUISA|nr:CLAVATA3/ESR (CLE)-related protein TDIF-like [Quillaja saponaria]